MDRPQRSFRAGHQMICIIAIMMIVTISAGAATPPILIGPANPGAEDGDSRWWVGASGKSYLSVDHTDPASGTNDFTLGNRSEIGNNSAAWRSVLFPLGPAANGRATMTLSFTYKLLDKVKDGDNVRIQFRFYDKTGTQLQNEENIFVGSRSHDSEMAEYKTMTMKNIYAFPGAEMADIHVNINLYGDHWSSGTARFDDFSITAAPSRWSWLHSHPEFIPRVILGISLILPIVIIWIIYKPRGAKRTTA